MVRVLRAFAVLVAAAGVAASEKSEGGQPSNSQLAELQDKELQNLRFYGRTSNAVGKPAELRQQLEKLDVQVRDGNAFDKRSVP